MAKYEKHIFICGNQREPESARGSCDPNGHGELQKAFKDRLSELGLKRKVRANKSGCLDWQARNDMGQTVVVYPGSLI